MADADTPAVPTIPRATYRVQLNAGFTFRDATAIVPYLAALGVSHVYCSPYFRARPGSTHGYDVIDHNAFNPEVGDRQDFEHFVAQLRAHGMGHLLDIVPNHVGVMEHGNHWWMDVLENGESSAYADYFDIDWAPPNPALAGKVLVPVLGDPYGVVLEHGELELKFERDLGAFAIFYHEHRFPLDPRTYPRILDAALVLKSGTALERLRRLFAALPERQAGSSERNAERQRDAARHKAELAELCAADPTVTEALEQALVTFAGRPDEPTSFDALHALLEEQAFRLAYWRVASDDINYRRFFDVNDLAALKVENEAVFDATHRLVFELIGAGALDGLRIDHIDGLYDPLGYLVRLSSRLAQCQSDAKVRPPYLVVEKITASFERLPAQWPVHGETGYRFANAVNRLLVDSAGRARLDRLYRRVLGEPLQWSDVAYEGQRLVLRKSLFSELNAVANRLTRIAQSDRRTRDFTFNSLRQALAEVIACFPVYRTYVADGLSDSDRRYVEWAVAAARRRRSDTEAPVFDFVRDALLVELDAPTERARALARRFAMKFQQTTAPAMAKGVEDTALYRFNRLTSLNEVGGEPAVFGSSIRAYHADAQYRAKHWPHEMLATSTHDTKRSEDVRARISVLSEAPRQWRAAVDRWWRLNRRWRREIDGAAAPSPNDEYLFYQTLIGTWPLESPAESDLERYRERIEAYMLKAAREAKTRTSWASVNVGYEEALAQFIRAALQRREGNLFLTDFCGFEARIVRFGLFNALTQTVLKLTAPGVPDIYQGNEVWEFALVDPDNRRPVDYAVRRALLEELAARPCRGEYARALAERPEDPRCKLYLLRAVLGLRREHEALFTHGEYLPLRVAGDRAQHLCAYARRFKGDVAIVLAPRHYLRLMGERDGAPLGAAIWSDTAVEVPRECTDLPLLNVLDGTRALASERETRTVFPVAQALQSFPVGVLWGQASV